jgi:hypothetical protein
MPLVPHAFPVKKSCAAVFVHTTAIVEKEEETMRIALISLAVLTVTLPAGVELASAQPRPYCMQSGRGGPGGGIPDCSFHTLEQCLASRGGGTDGCFANPALMWDRIEGKRTQQPRSRTGRGQ